MVHSQIPVHTLVPEIIDHCTLYSPVHLSRRLEPRVLIPLHVYGVPSLLASGFEWDTTVWQRLGYIVAVQDSRQLAFCGCFFFATIQFFIPEKLAELSHPTVIMPSALCPNILSSAVTMSRIPLN